MLPAAPFRAIEQNRSIVKPTYLLPAVSTVQGTAGSVLCWAAAATGLQQPRRGACLNAARQPVRCPGQHTPDLQARSGVYPTRIGLELDMYPPRLGKLCVCRSCTSILLLVHVHGHARGPLLHLLAAMVSGPVPVFTNVTTLIVRSGVDYSRKGPRCWPRTLGHSRLQDHQRHSGQQALQFTLERFDLPDIDDVIGCQCFSRLAIMHVHEPLPPCTGSRRQQASRPGSHDGAPFSVRTSEFHIVLACSQTMH